MATGSWEFVALIPTRWLRRKTYPAVLRRMEIREAHNAPKIAGDWFWMVSITFRQADGSAETIDIAEGHSLMEGAVRYGISGIDAECGGGLACATCQVRLEARWHQILGIPEESETEMLGFAVAADERSRLSCQVIVTPALEGMIVEVPENQHTL